MLGRVLAHKQTTNGVSYTTGYVYNLSGALTEETYPSGRIVKNVLNNNGDLSMVQSKKTSNTGYWNYADSFTYTAAGAVSSMQLGNGKWESTTFNSRLQPTQIALGTVQNGTDKLKLDFSYGTTQNNGNVQSQTITVPTVSTTAGFTATQSYTYDSLNRLKSAEETIPNQTGWKQTFQYDRYGNRNFDEANTTASINFPKNCGGAVCSTDVPVVNPTIDITKNRLNSYTYDASGNTTKDAQSRKFTYDAENKQTKVETVDSYNNPTSTVGEYFYDGDGRRVKKYVPSTGETTIFVYNASGQLVAEYATQTSATPQVSYLTNDHLGSPRINTDANGAVISRHDYQPFGEEIARGGYGADDVRKQFTGYERDIESELDFAQARYYNSKHGRFTSPDEPFADQYEDDPQSWNLYVYVGNNPLFFTDPTGLWKQVDCSSGKCWEADQEGDTFTSLAKILGLSVNDVTAFFGDVNPNNIQMGQTFDIAGFDQFVITRDFARAGIDVQGYDGQGVNPNDPKYNQKIPPEMQPDMPTGNYMKDGLPIFRDGIVDGIETFAPLPLPSKILVLGKILKASKKIIRQAGGRGWTKKMIQEAVEFGEKFAATNKATGGSATRYVHPKTGKSVVVDDATGKILQVGRSDFLY